MTKKDFELIAATLREVRDENANNPAISVRTLRIVAEYLADALDATNPRFKRDVFLKACER